MSEVKSFSNVLGLRWWGIWVALGSLLATILLVVLGGALDAGHWSDIRVLFAAALVLDLVFWLVAVTPKWVKQAGDAYAGRLIETVEFLKK